MKRRGRQREKLGHQKLRWKKRKKRRGRGDQVLVLEFCQGQWGMKRRGRQRQKLGHQKLRWKKRKRRGRGDQVLVLEFCQGQWEMRRRGRQRQKSQWKRRDVEDVATRCWC